MGISMILRDKNGKLALEYLAVIVLALLLLVVMLIFSTKVRDKITDAIKNFISVIGFS